MQKGLSPESLPGIVSPAGEQNHSLQNTKINPQVLFGPKFVIECKGGERNQEAFKLIMLKKKQNYFDLPMVHFELTYLVGRVCRGIRSR